jgi:hypothetical protein
VNHDRIDARTGMAAMRYWVGALAGMPLRERT